MYYPYKVHMVNNFSDWFAYHFVKFLAFFMDIIFKNRYAHRAVVLETVAGVPGMVGGMLRHFKSLRKIENDIYIQKLLEEAENERMHLMIYSNISKPNFLERLFIVIIQFLFFFFYALIYILFQKTAHRIVGYLEEEAIHSYTMFLELVENGVINNNKAPHIAIVYWGLNEEATLKDVIIATREDEIKHRDINHNLANNKN